MKVEPRQHALGKRVFVVQHVVLEGHERTHDFGDELASVEDQPIVLGSEVTLRFVMREDERLGRRSVVHEQASEALVCIREWCVLRWKILSYEPPPLLRLVPTFSSLKESASASSSINAAHWMNVPIRMSFSSER